MKRKTDRKEIGVWVLAALAAGLIFYGAYCQMEMCMDDGHSYWECTHFLGD